MTIADIIAEIKNPYDYDEYISWCDKNGIKAVEIGIFFSMSGVVYGSAKMFPEVTIPEAYTLFLNLNNPDRIKGCCDDKAKMPTMGEMIKSFSSTTAQFVMSGFQLAKDVDSRLNTCAKCEFITSNFRCKKCGCFMKLKARMSVSKCPIGKW